MDNGRGKILGILVTLLINGGGVILCGQMFLPQPAKPQESVEILIEPEELPEIEEVQQIEMAAGIEPRSENPKPDADVTLVQRAQAPVVAQRANETEDATIGETGDVEVPEPKREEVIDKRALFSAAKTNAKDTLAPQVAAEASDAIKSGDPLGNTRVGNPDGEPVARLEGRTVMGSLPKPGYNVQTSGKIVVRITVNQNGDVLSAIPGYTGTTLTNKTLWEEVKNAALKSKFNVSRNAPASQEGTITYIFNLK
ncbi:MAG: hypothetical protein HUJ90_04110 [Bacteroidales bacterium]|nr:hypothetical protein [Bacteroidales bacterium]